ncbi:DoxX family membrane protein [Natrialbaceae archaeon GCM10025810]|uniref:DoxX family membrane protein n=1 Tax=Halovalidus salilacus TaxID=3075124 RepID=UPI003613806C
MGTLSRLTRRSGSDEETRIPTAGSREAESESAAGPIQETSLFRLGRGLFAGVLALTALDNLRNLEERVQYAEAKNAPAPSVSVPAISGSLLVGSAGLVLWRAPAAAAAAIAGFLAGVTPVMHDFWNQEEPEQRQQEFTHFLKNTALFGAALAFATLGRRTERS